MTERKCTNKNLNCPKAITSTGIIGVCCVAQEWCPKQLPQDLYPILPIKPKDDSQQRIEELERRVFQNEETIITLKQTIERMKKDAPSVKSPYCQHNSWRSEDMHRIGDGTWCHVCKKQIDPAIMNRTFGKPEAEAVARPLPESSKPSPKPECDGSFCRFCGPMKCICDGYGNEVKPVTPEPAKCDCPTCGEFKPSSLDGVKIPALIKISKETDKFLKDVARHEEASKKVHMVFGEPAKEPCPTCGKFTNTICSNAYHLYEPAKEQTLEDAIDRGLKIFHEWNNVTGIFLKSTGYMAEAESVIEDAVRCGFYARSHSSDTKDKVAIPARVLSEIDKWQKFFDVIDTDVSEILRKALEGK